MGAHATTAGTSARPRFPPSLAVGLAVVSVSFAAPLFRLADAPATTASFWRLAFAVLLLAPFAWRALPEWRAFQSRTWFVVGIAGVALAFHFWLWVEALHRTSVASATVLVTLQAVFVALGGHWILGDKLRPMAWAGVLVALGGAAVMTLDAPGDGRPESLAGNLLALVAGLGSAAYMLIGRRVRRSTGLLAYVVPVYAVAALVLAVAAALTGDGLVQFATRSGKETTVWAFVFFVLLAAVPMLGGHTLSNWAIRYVPAHLVATWILLEPVGAALLAIPLFGEIPGPLLLVGGGMVLAGAVLTLQRTRGASQVAG